MLIYPVSFNGEKCPSAVHKVEVNNNELKLHFTSEHLGIKFIEFLMKYFQVGICVAVGGTLTVTFGSNDLLKEGIAKIKSVPPVKVLHAPPIPILLKEDVDMLLTQLI